MADPDVTESPRARASRLAKPATMRGFVMSEGADFKLATHARAMRGIATLIETDLPGHVMPDIAPDDLAAIFYTLAEATESIRAATAYALADVPVRPREDI